MKTTNTHIFEAAGRKVTATVTDVGTLRHVALHRDRPLLPKSIAKFGAWLWKIVGSPYLRSVYLESPKGGMMLWKDGGFRIWGCGHFDCYIDQ
jgi:hypothetical protein